LHAACVGQHYAIAEYLLRKKIPVNQSDFVVCFLMIFNDTQSETVNSDHFVVFVFLESVDTITFGMSIAR
jgi:hypothetical protein